MASTDARSPSNTASTRAVGPFPNPPAPPRKGTPPPAPARKQTPWTWPDTQTWARKRSGLASSVMATRLSAGWRRRPPDSAPHRPVVSVQAAIRPGERGGTKEDPVDRRRGDLHGHPGVEQVAGLLDPIERAESDEQGPGAGEPQPDLARRDRRDVGPPLGVMRQGECQQVLQQRAESLDGRGIEEVLGRQAQGHEVLPGQVAPADPEILC